MLSFTLALICLVVNIDAFVFSSSSFTEIHDGNVTCIIQDGELTVNGEPRGNLTEEQQQELEEYKKSVEEYSKWYITKALEHFARIFGDIFGFDGALWNGFGLFGGKKNGSESTIAPTTPEPSQPKEPPQIPSFCTA